MGTIEIRWGVPGMMIGDEQVADRYSAHRAGAIIKAALSDAGIAVPAADWDCHFERRIAVPAEVADKIRSAVRAPIATPPPAPKTEQLWGEDNPYGNRT